MRKILPLTFSALSIFCLAGQTAAQNDQFAYAITDVSKEGTAWNVLRKVNLKTGEYSTALLNGSDAKTAAFDAATKRQLVLTNNATQIPFNTGVAAIALDKANNRLYFTPMFYHQLRYIDLATLKVYNITDQPLTKDIEQKDPGKTFSRMVITPEGIGYAISNDAEEFIQFNTSKTTTVKQLGRLVDAPGNKGISVHNSCTSYGGDIVSDDNGTLYLVTGVNNVFTIDTKTKIATHLGSVKGLPANFTTSAAVVHTDGQLLIASASGSFSPYVVNPKTWQATAFSEAGIAYHTSDLANSNYIATRPKTKAIETIKGPVSTSANKIQVYPNPVIDNTSFNVRFSNLANGAYILQLIDLAGSPVYSRRISITSKNNTQTIPISLSNANGIYLVRVVDAAKKSVFEQKLMVH